MGKRFTNEQRQEAVNKFSSGELTLKETAKKYGVTETTILNWKKKLPVRNRISRFDVSDKVEIITYRMSGHTLAETSAKYNVSECSIRLFEKEYGVSESAKDARKNMRAKKELADMSAKNSMDQMYSFFRILENKIHLKRIVRQFAAAPIKINSTYKNKYKKPKNQRLLLSK